MRAALAPRRQRLRDVVLAERSADAAAGGRCARVAGREVVDGEHLVALREQAIAEVAAEEAGAAGDERDRGRRDRGMFLSFIGRRERGRPASRRRSGRCRSARARRRGRLAEPAREGGVGEQRLHAVDQGVDVGVDEAVLAVADDRDELGRGEADDRQADHHRFDDRQAEAGVADRVEEEAVRGHRTPGSASVRDLADAADGLGCPCQPGRAARAARPRAKTSSAEAPAAPRQVVDDDDAARAARRCSAHRRARSTPCSITRVGVRPLSHISALNGVTWTSSTFGSSTQWRVSVGCSCGGSCSM